MEKCTLEELYDLVIDYYIKGYGLMYGSYESNPRNDEMHKLQFYLRTVTYYVDWDNIPESISEPFWDNTLTIPRYLT